MRILHSVHSANPKGGGPIEGIKQLSRMNIEAGHCVEVVTLDDPQSPWLKDFPIPIYALGPSYFRYGYSSRFIPWIKQNHHKYDIVIVNGLWQYSSFAIWKALRDTATQYCVFTHGMLDPWFKKHYPFKHLKKWLYWPWGEYRVLRDALAVMFTTEEERRLARRSFWLYHCDEIVVSYGIVAVSGDNTKRREIFFEKFPELRGKQILLFFGRIHEKKGGDLLIQAFAKLIKTMAASEESLHLVMAGPADSEHGNSLKKLADRLDIKSHVTWTGPLYGDLKWGAFAAADAFILPSHQENFGIAVAESLAAGVPVLISNRVNIWREVKLHNAGYIQSDDFDGTFRLIEDWFKTDPKTRHEMRRNAVHCFNKCFNLESFADSFVETLARLGMPKQEEQ